MFDFLEKSIENALGITGDLLDGEAPKKEQVAKLIADGLTIAAISEMTGIAVEVIEQFQEVDGE